MIPSLFAADESIPARVWSGDEGFTVIWPYGSIPCLPDASPLGFLGTGMLDMGKVSDQRGDRSHRSQHIFMVLLFRYHRSIVLAHGFAYTAAPSPSFRCLSVASIAIIEAESGEYGTLGAKVRNKLSWSRWS
jgi:hypothetical protein